MDNNIVVNSIECFLQIGICCYIVSARKSVMVLYEGITDECIIHKAFTTSISGSIYKIIIIQEIIWRWLCLLRMFVIWKVLWFGGEQLMVIKFHYSPKGVGTRGNFKMKLPTFSCKFGKSIFSRIESSDLRNWGCKKWLICIWIIFLKNV